MPFRLCFLLLFACPVLAQTPGCKLKAGKELSLARQRQFEALLKSGGDVAAVRFDLALNHAKIGNQRKALEVLQQALAETPWLDPSAEPDFSALQPCLEFQKLVARVRAKYPRRTAGSIAFVVNQKDLIPEGLAADPVDGSLYLSSIYHRKILKISPAGAVRDFVQESQDGLLGVLGIKVDPRDRSIWSASERSGASALFHFDSNGKTLGKYVPAEEGKHLFNDLVITQSGDVFVTDSEDNSFYKLPHGSNKLIRISLGQRLYPNGITISDDGMTLYMAHAFGVARFDIRQGSLSELPAPKEISLAQADGLYFWQGNLIAIQNGLGANRIVQLRLTADGKKVAEGKLLQFRSDNLELPTTGAVYKNHFYYIVNSQIDHEQDGKLKNEDQLRPVKIAVVPLN